MPIYKKLPTKKRKALPFYRPIDRFFFALWDRRRALTPYVVVLLIVGLLYGGLRLYAARYEGKAALLFASGNLQEVVKGYPRSQAAEVSRVRLGGRALEEGRLDEALDWYRPVAEDRNSAPLLRIAALQNEALIYLKKGDPSRAAEILDKASRDVTNQASDYTQLLLAVVYSEKGEADKARVILKTLSEGAKSPSVQQEASARLAWMEGGNEKKKEAP